MGKYIDKELLVQLISASVDQIEEMIDNTSPSVVQELGALVQQGVEMGALDSETTDFTYQQIMAGMGLMHIATNIIETCHSLLADPTVTRTVVRSDDGKKFNIEEISVTPEEIHMTVNTGIEDLEKYLTELNGQLGSDKQM